MALSAALASGLPGAPPAHGASPAPFPAAGVILVDRLVVRAAPSPAAAVLARLPQFRRDFRRTVVLAIAGRAAEGRRWLRIHVPGRPNGRAGWVRRESVRVWPARRLIVIDRSERRLRLYADGRLRYSTRVAVGRPGMETPLGNFYVRARYRPVERFLGAYALETSAYSRLSEWPGGGIVGIHGWNDPSVLGTAASHGCIRVANSAIRALRGMVPVGTPIRIVR